VATGGDELGVGLAGLDPVAMDVVGVRLGTLLLGAGTTTGAGLAAAVTLGVTGRFLVTSVGGGVAGLGVAVGEGAGATVAAASADDAGAAGGLGLAVGWYAKAPSDRLRVPNRVSSQAVAR
jgi:hypothetical protein